MFGFFGERGECGDCLESKQIGEVEAEELLSPVAWEASVVHGTKMCVWVQIGPVFIGSVEKVSGGRVCHRPCREGGCCGWAAELLLVLELCFHQGQIRGGKQGG